MTTAKTIAGVVPGLMATSLVLHNIPKLKKGKMSSKKMVKLGMTNLIGVGLIGATSSAINKL